MSLGGSRSRYVRVLNDWLPLKYFSDLTFIYWFAGVVKLEFISATSHAKDLEAVNFGDKSWRRHHIIIEMLYQKDELIRFGDLIKSTYFEENMRETGSEVRPINVKLFLTRKVHVLAARTVDFDS